MRERGKEKRSELGQESSLYRYQLNRMEGGLSGEGYTLSEGNVRKGGMARNPTNRENREETQALSFSYSWEQLRGGGRIILYGRNQMKSWDSVGLGESRNWLSGRRNGRESGSKRHVDSRGRKNFLFTSPHNNHILEIEIDKTKETYHEKGGREANRRRKSTCHKDSRRSRRGEAICTHAKQIFQTIYESSRERR